MTALKSIFRVWPFESIGRLLNIRKHVYVRTRKEKKKKEHHAAEVCYEHFMDVAKMCNVKRKVEHLLARNV